MRKKKWIPVVVVTLLCCGLMAVVDGIWMPGYVVKSLCKVALFLFLPLLCTLGGSSVLPLKSLLRVNKKGILVALGLGIGLYGLITGGYFLLSPYFDFSRIAGNLSETAGVTAENFLFVSLYISFINSLLEEFFFRGFVFMNLGTSLGRKRAYWFSALAFALYHTAMMLGWFSLPLFLLVMAGLTVGGLIFNRLNESFGTVFVSWIVHMFANFAINTIGFILLNS